MANLSVDFKDDILASSNPKRRYQLIHNSDGTVSLEDVTAYQQNGSDFGAKEVNEERAAINKINNDRIVTLDEIDLVNQAGFFVDALAVKELNSTLTNISGYSKSERKIGTWINGAPLYEKTVEFANIDIQNGVILQHGIQGINVVHDVCAVFMDGTVCNPFPIVDERGILLQIMANHSILKFVGNVSYSATTSRIVRATLRYTKD